MDAKALDLVSATLRKALANRGEESMASLLRDQEWKALFDDDRQIAIRGLFETHGQLCAPGCALDVAVLGSMDLDPETHAILYPLPGPIATGHPDTANISGVVLSATQDLRTLVIPLVTSSGTAGAVTRPADSSWHWCSASAWVTDVNMRRVTGSLFVEANERMHNWQDALAVARTALAAELIGLGKAMFDIAAKHVTDRRQFGRVLSDFQVVRHRLADAHVFLSGAEALLHAALGTDGVAKARSAKAFAGAAACEVAGIAQQLCGAMGWTDEFGLHRFRRRTLLLDGLLGSHEAVAWEIARSMCADGSVPDAINTSPSQPQELEHVNYA